MSSSAAHSETAEPSAEDGRHARRERNRLAVVDAMLQLYRDGNLDPSSDEIAERAGLSPRSLFRYFEDLDDLVRVAISRQHERLEPLARVDTASDGPLAERIERLVEQRLRLFEKIGSVGLVSRVREPFQPLIASELAISRSFLRRQLEQLFQPELTQQGKGAAAVTLAAADVLTSFESVRLLLDDQQLTPAQVHATLVGALTSLLEA